MRAATLRIYSPVGTYLNRCASVCGGIRLSGQVAQFDRPFLGALGHAGMKDGGPLCAGCWPCRGDHHQTTNMLVSFGRTGWRGHVRGSADGVDEPEQERSIPGARHSKAGNQLLQPPSCDAGSRRAGRPCRTSDMGSARLSPSHLFEGRHMGAPVLQWHWCPAWSRPTSGCGHRHRLPRFPSPRPGHRQPRGGRATPITARNNLALRMAPCPMQRVGYRRA